MLVTESMTAPGQLSVVSDFEEKKSESSLFVGDGFDAVAAAPEEQALNTEDDHHSDENFQSLLAYVKDQAEKKFAETARVTKNQKIHRALVAYHEIKEQYKEIPYRGIEIDRAA